MKANRSGVIARKLGMSQIYKDNGEAVPVTIIHVDENVVLSIKTEGKDGYNALQLASFKQKTQRLKKSIKGLFEKAKVEPKKRLKNLQLLKNTCLRLEKK